MLEEIRDNLMLDMYLASHVKTLYSMIRNRGLIQYFRYATLDIDITPMLTEHFISDDLYNSALTCRPTCD